MLTVFVTLSVSLSLVHASSMATQMTMTPAMGVSGYDDCYGGAADARKAKSIGCMASCIAPIPATLPQAIATPLAATPVKLDLPSVSLPNGSRSALDPYPPRSPYIG